MMNSEKCAYVICTENNYYNDVTYLNAEDFNHICRLCLSNTRLSNLFTVAYDGTQLWNLVRQCASIKVHYEHLY